MQAWGQTARVSSPLPWIAPSAIAAGALIVSSLTYRIVRRQGQVSWKVRVEPDARAAFKHLVVTRATGPAARNVRVQLDPPQIVVTGLGAKNGPEAVPRLDPGGYIDVMWVTPLALPLPSAVEVTWDGRFGRSKTWRSGI